MSQTRIWLDIFEDIKKRNKILCSYQKWFSPKIVNDIDDLYDLWSERQQNKTIWKIWSYLCQRVRNTHQKTKKKAWMSID